MKKKRWLSILLSLSLLLTLVPAQAFAEEGPEGTESACTQTADCPAQVHEPDCPLWQEDSTGPEETGPDETGPEETAPDETGPGETGPEETIPGETSPEEPAEPGQPEETQPTALEQLLALAETLPDPAEVTADNADEVTSQLQAFTQLYAAMTADEQESDEAYAALARVLALQSALDALTDEDSGPAMLAETTTGVEYIDAAYNEATGKVDYTPTTTAEGVTVTVVDSSTTTWGTSGSTTWYVVSEDVTISNRITVSGDVHLILTDNYTLNAKKGITVNSGSSLTIYGQESGTGTLTTGTPNNYYAGIGGYGTGISNPGTSGAITIHGGTVKATGSSNAAGIGGGRGGSGTVTINGGTVTGTGGTLAAGIGGGYYGAGTVTIHGGTVTATGGTNGAGIGGGDLYSGYVTITGGTVKATGGSSGAGIGGGYAENASPSTIVKISGGTVTAKGGSGGAGIGTGNRSNKASLTGTISINGGFVTATGGAQFKSGDYTYGAGAAIGSGGVRSSSSAGAEADESNFTNAVVLRQSGASGSTLTGTVYGDATLTTDATVPSGASLEVPAGSTLIVANGATLTLNSGSTMTNNGAIYVEEGATFYYSTTSGESYGILTNNGTLKTDVVPVQYEAYEDGQFVTKTVYDYTVVTDQTAWGTAGQETWYVVNSATPLTITKRITVSGDVHLILADGAKLTASKGITVAGTNSLTIYGQTEGTGELTTGTPDDNYAGIGSGSHSNSTVTVTIHGGTVNATGGDSGAGIGSGFYGTSSTVTVTIHGGTVNATGGDSGAGIGSGYYGTSSAITITISGGTVTAEGGKKGAGIGSGFYGGSSAITISGGTVTAEGGEYGAGIGSGYYSGSPTITINSGVVTAKGGAAAAGIGGGGLGDSGTITISGGFVAATGGTKSGSVGAGAAIGSGGALGGNTGAEVAESNFNNAVVLKQSGAPSSTPLTGQVYGEPTLTTDAEVPAGATLTIPEGTSLTIAGGVTLTNGGAICMEGGSLQYGDPNYGTLTNEGGGKFYYLLTIEGGTATATEGMATYNGKTYATQGTAVTLTAEDQVGLALKEWTASPTSANVTFTKVEGTAETAETYQFTMPAQVLTVTAGYENAPAYTVTIPASVTIGGSATINATNVNVAQDYSLNVKLTATSGADNAFTLALENHPEETLAYTVTQNEQNVNVNDTVLTVAGGTANSSGTAILTFALADTVKYAGEYSGTVTFTVSVEEVPTTSDEQP